MPKLKTKSSTKRRFRLTAKGKVRMNPAGKRHFLRRRPKKMKRQTRGTEIMSAADSKIVKSYMPYGR
ncbi:MAG: 50S ribosomal protein L35 [Alphaproteobacteria bacterium]|nr:50S ribosomal protein L35 [Alphaproteobacteria bacterium]